MEQRIAILPGGGAGTLDKPIQLYIAWGRPFVVMLDNDDAGRAQARRYIEKFGSILQPHLTDLATACGSTTVRGLESMLTDDDLLEFQRVVDPGAAMYHKKTFLLGVQEALAERKQVQLSSTTRQSLDKLLADLRQRPQQIQTTASL